ncbi:MAG: single-stranded DNA-binding protein [Micrococcales bacterium]|jgi:single-strand DNA-binding protein|nr:single-stranded DNA-binding protein [Aquiluna sp.]MBT5431091.1 single-stranded DNA-binding protein [Micrococcales bacterium]MBT7926432.1 single-stranded DNA-binding protein [Micrococcales bacterium]MDA8902037.1 single-stranded DNA-binding protein [Aquiluna sp.]MDG1817746.1 single-stranded DNA-binding protein [Aquiluna sp.]MDG2478654.1 single-stranded DNA-binding protein [Aquiluna sp.]
MAGEVSVTIVGNLADDPELRYTQGGVAVASVRVGSTPRTFNRSTNEWVDGETVWVRCTAWREVAENVAQSLTKGTRVVVTGRLKPPSAYQSAQGEARASLELEIDEIGPSLRYATASVTRRAREGSAQVESPWGGQQAETKQASSGAEAWANPATAPSDEAPF